MAHVTTPPAPGSMTVPPLFGWEGIILVLALLTAVAVAFLLIGAAGSSARGRSEWEAWLEARSRPRESPAGGAGHQRRGLVSRDCAVRHGRQFPHAAMATGVVGEPHSGQSTDSCDRARASMRSSDRSSWIVSSPRQGHPR
jgi:hypothetical protein